MDKPISPRTHGLLDYATVATLAAAPAVLGLSGPAARLSRGLAGGYLGLSLFTDYAPSLKRVVPLRVHGATDAVMGLALPALPWVVGFARDRRARNFFLGMTAVTGAVTALTDWSRGGEPAQA